MQHISLLLMASAFAISISIPSALLAQRFTTPDEWVDHGITLLEREQYPEALKMFDKAIELNPNHVRALTAKGAALIPLRRYQEAIQYYDRAIRIEPNLVVAAYNKGIALSKLGKYKEAIDSYDNAIRIAPRVSNVALIWNSKGEALVELKKFKDALRSFDEGIKIEGNYPACWFNIARTYSLLKDKWEAITNLRRAIVVGGASYKERAKTDVAFKWLGDDRDFQRAVGLTMEEQLMKKGKDTPPISVRDKTVQERIRKINPSKIGFDSEGHIITKDLSYEEMRRLAEILSEISK